MDKPEVSRIPDYMGNHKTYRAVVEADSEVEHIPLTLPNAEEAPPSTSNLIGSFAGLRYKTRMHRVLLDLDMKADLIPSSTPGHYHLYIDQEIPENHYEVLLNALYNAGVIQFGFLQSFRTNKQTTVRIPGVQKEGAFEQAIAKELKGRLTEGKTVEELEAMKRQIEEAIQKRNEFGW